MRYRYSKYLNALIFIGDVLLLNASYLLTYYILHHSIGVFSEQLKLLLFSNTSWALLAIIGRNYVISRISTISMIIRQVIRFSLVHLLALTALVFFNNSFSYSRELIILNYAFFPVFLILWRAIFIYIIRIYRKYGFNYRNVVIVGYGDVSYELNKFFRLHPEFGYKFLGYFDENPITGRSIALSELENYVEENKVDEIYCCLPYVKYSKIQNLIDFGERNLIKVKLIADFRGFINKGIEMEAYDGIPVMNVTSFPLDIRKNQFIKRSFDIAFSSLVILLIFSWLFPVLAILIKLDSRGPVFFKQKRTGKKNGAFWCWKFRTMIVNDEADNKQACQNDERVTRLGRILRKTSLDELPQFINVFLGNMSVVGPRPHMLNHTKEYSKKVEKFMVRHFVKPGITGLAQTRGYRGETVNVVSMKNRVKLDRFYIQNWSLLLDIKIIILTMTSLLKEDKNAY